MPLVDIVARVAAQQTADGYLVVCISAWCRLGDKWQVGQCVNTSGTADKDLALILRVEIYEILTRNHPLAKAESTRQARLLIDREESLNRAVLQLLVDKHCQSRRNTYTVVGTECRAFGTHPAVLDVRADGILLEVELHVGILLAHHIHVSL